MASADFGPGSAGGGDGGSISASTPPAGWRHLRTTWLPRSCTARGGRRMRFRSRSSPTLTRFVGSRRWCAAAWAWTSRCRRKGTGPPSAEHLLTLFEITVVGFWRDQVTEHGADLRRDIESAARRLAEAAQILFWSQASGHPTPLDALTRLLARRLDQSFRRADVTREVLADEGDEEGRIAFWLVFPDERPGGGFRATMGTSTRTSWVNLATSPDRLSPGGRPSLGSPHRFTPGRSAWLIGPGPRRSTPMRAAITRSSFVCNRPMSRHNSTASRTGCEGNREIVVLAARMGPPIRSATCCRLNLERRLMVIRCELQTASPAGRLRAGPGGCDRPVSGWRGRIPRRLAAGFRWRPRTRMRGKLSSRFQVFVQLTQDGTQQGEVVVIKRIFIDGTGLLILPGRIGDDEVERFRFPDRGIGATPDPAD